MRTLLIALLIATSPPSEPHATRAADAGVTMVFRNLADFNTAAGTPSIAITFDDFAPGDELDGREICGVRFQKVNAPLVVVRADETYTPAGFANVGNPKEVGLRSSSGSQLLSPGGPELAAGPAAAVEDDDIHMLFDRPVASLGFDHVSQLADGNSFTHIEVFDESGTVLYSGTVEIGPNWEELGGRKFIGPGGQEDPDGMAAVDFWGIVSTSANIARVHIDERDDDNVNADSNIGIDTVRLAPTTCGLSGDINGDGAVNHADLKLVRASLGQRSLSRDGAKLQWNPADLNRDGQVNTDDIAGLLQRLGQ